MKRLVAQLLVFSLSMYCSYKLWGPPKIKSQGTGGGFHHHFIIFSFLSYPSESERKPRERQRERERMGHTINIEHHQATDGLVNLFTKASHDLTVVQHRLKKEFQQVYPNNGNDSFPLSLFISELCFVLSKLL